MHATTGIQNNPQIPPFPLKHARRTSDEESGEIHASATPSPELLEQRPPSALDSQHLTALHHVVRHRAPGINLLCAQRRHEVGPVRLKHPLLVTVCETMNGVEFRLRHLGHVHLIERMG